VVSEEDVRKHFFFEKRRKNFYLPGSAQGRSTERHVMKAQEKKFFGSFFQKRTFFLP
jgi:hypothetical protein